ncbi:unnamed protein product, partial [Adineta steineri]
MTDIRPKNDRNENNERVDTMGTNVYSSKDNQSMHNSLNSEFILYQVLLQQILNGESSLTKVPSSILKYFEPDDKTDQKIMKEFDKEYEPSKAIHWYTKESCIYKILNKALRTQNIDDINPFGYFIRDLDTQLEKEHKLFVKQQNKSSIQVYRGQFISKDELNRLKTTQGELISMNSFLSTSTNKTKAVEFATSRPPPTDQLTPILLEINVDLNAFTKPFADIKHLSAFSEEEEILFMFGAIFRLDQIYYNKEVKLWIANLTLCTLADQDVKQLTSTLDDQLDGQNQLIALGNYFTQMMKYDQAKEHFEKILKNNLTKDPIELAYCHHGLSRVNKKQMDYISGKKNIEKSLDYLIKNAKEKDHPLISQCYND